MSDRKRGSSHALRQGMSLYEAQKYIRTSSIMSAEGANMLRLPFATITGLLGGLAKPTGCSGIVNINQIQSSPLIRNF
jgi:hypothetical protein